MEQVPKVANPLERLGAASNFRSSHVRYELLDTIAAGGMATVSIARAHGLSGFERLVAIKCCHPHLKDQVEFRTMFIEEARTAALIRHPNVVPVIDFGEEPAPYLVMEYIEGRSLGQLLKTTQQKRQPLPIGVTLKILTDTLAGLQAAHTLRTTTGESISIIHRDVSPQNVMIGVDGTSRIVDFGVAKASIHASVTREGMIKGKLGYAAPEIFEGAPGTVATDLYAVGVLLWESLTNERLFQRNSEAEIVSAILLNAIPLPSSKNPAVTPKLDALVIKSLARKPADRFVSAEAFLDALEKCGLPLATPRGITAELERLCGGALLSRRQQIEQAVGSSERSIQWFNAGAAGEVPAVKPPSLIPAAKPVEQLILGPSNQSLFVSLREQSRAAAIGPRMAVFGVVSLLLFGVFGASIGRWSRGPARQTLSPVSATHSATSRDPLNDPVVSPLTVTIPSVAPTTESRGPDAGAAVGAVHPLPAAALATPLLVQSNTRLPSSGAGSPRLTSGAATSAPRVGVRPRRPPMVIPGGI